MHVLHEAIKAASMYVGRWASVKHAQLLTQSVLPNELDLEVLFRRPLGIGDLVMMAPFIQALATHWMRGQVWLVTEHEPFLDFGPRLSWVDPGQRKGSGRAAVAVSPTYTLRHIGAVFSGQPYVGYFLSNVAMCSFSKVAIEYEPKFQHYLARALPLLDPLGLKEVAQELVFPDLLSDPLAELMVLPKRYICIAPHANWLERQYPVERIGEVVRRLVKHCPIVLVGGGQGEEYANICKLEAEVSDGRVYNVAGRLTLRQTIRVIQEASLFIGNDGGLTHLSFLGAPAVIALFGCVRPDTRVPLIRRHGTEIVALSGGGGCDLFPCYDGYVKPMCRRRLQCLTDITVEEIVDHALRLIG